MQMCTPTRSTYSHARTIPQIQIPSPKPVLQGMAGSRVFNFFMSVLYILNKMFQDLLHHSRGILMNSSRLLTITK